MRMLGMWCVVAIVAVSVGCRGKTSEEKAPPTRVELEPMTLAQLDFGDKAKAKTEVRIAHDAGSLYVTVECFDDAATLKNLRADTDTHDGDDIWNDDCIELFLDPSGAKKSYYQIIVNAKGVTWDAYHVLASSPDRSWEPKLDVKTTIGDRIWTVSVTVPLSTFDRQEAMQSTWALNVSRTRTADGEVSYWKAPMDTSSHVPGKFGMLDNMPGKTPAGEGTR